MMITASTNTQQKLFDSAAFNQAIGSCLDSVNALCNELINIDRIHIIVEIQLLSSLTIYNIDTKTNQKEICTQITPSSLQDLGAEIYTQAAHYNQATCKQIFSELVPKSFYNTVRSCYHIPLYWTEQFQSAIQFLRTSNNRFSSKEIENLKQLSKLVENVISGLFTIDHLTHENELLAYEHQKDHILVEVTNTAIATRDMDNMLKSISKNIIDFFNIDYIGLILRTNENQQQITLYSTQRLPNKQLNHTQYLLNAQDPLVNKMMAKMPSGIFSIDSLNKKYGNNKQLYLMQDVGLQALYSTPLKFSNQQYGTVLFAHKHRNIFTADNITMFQHIADRIVIAADNIQAYQHITNLNNSLTNENLYLSEEIELLDQFGEIIGLSPAIKKVLDQVEMVADSNSSVLLLGETGTGKELFAKAIHNRSYRHDKRMIKINCSAVPANLLESELFGHERGAFTGANNQRIGRFELAKGSTLLLDEIGDIPLELQSKLLRVLQEREIERLGSNKTIPVDVRLISATNCNLEQMIEEKTFRADLYYRLNVFPIIIPPLRERKTDIAVLAQFFTQKFANQMKRDIDSISAKTLNQLCSYHWPGNVRELANVIERAVILNKGHILHLNSQSFPLVDKSVVEEKFKPHESTKKSSVPPNHPDTILREKITQVLKETNGIIAGPKGAAIRLGVKRTTLLSRMQRLGISTKDIFQED